MRLQDKVAIVTGAGSGIGQATALLFAQQGARLVLNDIDQQGLESVLTEVGKGKGRAVVGDVAQEETARSLAQEAVSAFGHIDVLVNNAGVFFDKDITDMTVEEWDRLMDVNLKSMFLCCKHVIPQMLRQKKGSIVNLASISSFIGMEMEGVSTFAYCITKAGALQLTKSLTTRYAAEGIRVNCVCPSFIETNVLKHRGTPEWVAELWRTAGAALPIGRPGRPEEVANAILFLASDEASFVTGCPLLVDGGYLARSGTAPKKNDVRINSLRQAFEVLGLAPGKITLGAARAAYKTRMLEYHPDRVQHLGPELRELAARKAPEINLALGLHPEALSQVAILHNSNQQL